MKKLYILIILLGVAANAQSQDTWGDTWGPPYPLTDSLTDNVNATLSILPQEVWQPDTLYMLWERSSDPFSTGIYARNLTTMAGPFMVAAQLNVHFKHPRVFRRGTGDTLFYFSYETDMNGNWDLYYSILMKNEVALGPYPFIQSSLNERTLNWGNSMFFTWEKEGNIYAKEFFSDTVHLAGDSCHNPISLSSAIVAYEMALGTEIGAFFSIYDDIGHNWTGPFPIDISGTNTHLTFGNDSYGAGGSILFWQNNNGTFWTIKGFDPNFITYYSFNNFPGCNNISPSYCYVNITTYQTFPAFCTFSTFASDVTGNMEIYVNNVLGDTIYSNLSGYSGIDAHPQLFNNFNTLFGALDNQLFDIWESYRGGHWQLWATKMDFLTGEGNLKNQFARMKCSPNPFTDLTRIEYFIREEGSTCFTIFDLNGKKIVNMNSTSEGNGKHSVTWNGRDGSGALVPAGIYVCALNTGNTVSRCKIIRL